MVTTRDIDKILSLLRRVYGSIVIDMSSALNDINLAFLDLSDTIVEIVTYDSTTIHNTMAVADTFRMIGYPATKVRYLVNRADSPGGIDPERSRAGPRPRPGAPRRQRRHARRPVEQRGRAVRPRQPGRPDQPGPRPRRRRAARGRAASSGPPRQPAGADGSAVSDPRPIGVFDSGVGGLTVLREILRRSPAESTIYLGDNVRAPYGIRPDDEVRAFSIEALDELVERDVKAIVVACNTSTAVALGDFRRRYDLPILGVVRPGAVTAVADDPQPAGRRDRDAGDGPLARLLQRDQGREPGGRGLRARDAGVRAAGRGRAGSAGRRSRRIVADVARAAARRARRGRRVRLPAAGVGADRHAPARLHPLPAAPAGDRRRSPGEGVAIVDSATATASALVELLAINGLEAPGSGDDRGSGGRRRRPDAGTGDASPADDRRRRRLPDGRRADLRRGVPRRRVGRGRGRRPMSRPAGARGRVATHARHATMSVMTRTRAAEPLPPRRTGPLGRPAWRDDRVWQAGFLVGSALGAAATVLGRRAERSARQGLVDWPRRGARSRSAGSGPRRAR